MVKRSLNIEYFEFESCNGLNEELRKLVDEADSNLKMLMHLIPSLK